MVRFNKESLRITICNLYPGLELTSPIYCNNSICHISPSQQTEVGVILASFGIASNHKDIKGALLYKLQRKYARTNNHINSDIVPTENTATNIYLLVIWNIVDDDHKFYVCLLKCADDFIWNEDKLWTLRHKYNAQFLKDYDYKTITWLIYGNAMMKTKYDITYGSDYRLDIVISEGTRKYVMFKPIKIDPERLVLSLSMLIILTYTVSLSIRSLVKLNIHDQCLNVGLVSPIYITGNGLECHKPPAYRVYAGETMRSGFIINKSDDMFYGVLIYRLQRRWTHESTDIGKDAISAAHLLVVWRISEFNELYADVLLIEHTKAFTWDEDNLKKLYYENYDRLKGYAGTISNTWLIDNMVLRTTFSARNLRGNPKLSISISEERDDYAASPFCIDLTR
jgi:hypothetical protein